MRAGEIGDGEGAGPECVPAAQPLGCLLLHGLGGRPYELGRLPEALREAGYLVNTPVLPGHEGPGPRMPDSRWEDWLATTRRAYEGLVASAGQPAVVLGFSTGGTLGLRLALEERLAGLVLLAPFLAIRYSGLVPLRPVSYLRRIAQVVPQLPRRPPAVRDAEMRRWAAGQDPFKTFSLGATISALELIEVVTPRVGEIAVPCLIQQGKLDTVVEPANAAWLHTHLGSARKRLAWYARSDHLLALDRQRSEVESDLLGFLASLARPPGRNAKEPVA
jgi:carboxylesterase